MTELGTLFPACRTLLGVPEFDALCQTHALTAEPAASAAAQLIALLQQQEADSPWLADLAELGGPLSRRCKPRRAPRLIWPRCRRYPPMSTLIWSSPLRRA
ncbi:hypothetical protein PCI56_18730 [Plesiomonas shigelloides subsp. oncorhynchi]|nr:hypothetical protein [Plesiomonas shigelloides]